MILHHGVGGRGDYLVGTNIMKGKRKRKKGGKEEIEDTDAIR